MVVCQGAVSPIRLSSFARPLLYTYDALGRLTQEARSDGSNVAFTYDAVGKRMSLTDAGGTTTYEYDAVGRLTQVTAPGAKVTAYAYDLAGRRTSVTSPSGRTVDYTYDDAGRLVGVAVWGEGTITYTHGAGGDLARVSRPNGKNTDHAYDGAGRIAQITERSGEVERSSIAYEYDATGRRTSATDVTGETQYAYDALGRLTQVAYSSGRTEVFSYDTAGNRLQRVDSAADTTDYTYDAANRMLTAGAATYAWNADGSLLSETGEGDRHYGYDTLERPIQVSGDATATVGYAGDGTRTTLTTPAGETTYDWDLSAPLPLLLEQGGVGEAGFAWAGGLLARQAGGQTSYAHTDALGSVREETDGWGATLDAAAYDAFGASPEEPTSAFAFTGEQRDQETGLYYLRARYYDPATGRFLTRDTYAGDMRDTQSLNRYTYCDNDPVNATDASGHVPSSRPSAYVDYRCAPNPSYQGPLVLPPGYWAVTSGCSGSSTALANLLGRDQQITQYLSKELDKFGNGKLVETIVTRAATGSLKYVAGKAVELGPQVGSSLGGQVVGQAFNAPKYANIWLSGMVISDYYQAVVDIGNGACF